MKRIISVLIALALIVTALPAAGLIPAVRAWTDGTAAFPALGMDFHVFSDGTAVLTTTYPTKVTGSVNVPGQISYNGETYTVTAIGPSAFFNCDAMTSVSLPETLKTIGDSAFYSCDGIKTITIPASVTSISSRAPFKQCYSLTAVNVESGNKYYWSNGGVLYNNGSTELVIVPAAKYKTDQAFNVWSSVNKIDDYAFSGCSHITRINGLDGVKTFGEYCFQGTGISDIVLPEGMTAIPDGMFASCKKLTYFTVPRTVTSIGEYAFLSCTGIEELYILAPDGGKLTVGDCAFAECSDTILLHYSGKKAQWNANVTVVDTSAENQPLIDAAASSVVLWGTTTFACGGSVFTIYNDKAGLADAADDRAELRFGDTVYGYKFVQIENKAFDGSNCTGLYIPASVEIIRYDAFINTPYLSFIRVAEDNNYFVSQGDILYTKDMTRLIRCPQAIADTQITVPASVTALDDGAFYGCTNVEKVDLSYTEATSGKASHIALAKIGEYAFSGCTALKTFRVPDGVSKIFYDTFMNCTSLNYVQLPIGLSEIDEDAFKNDTSLMTLYYQGNETNKKSMSVSTSALPSYTNWVYNAYVFGIYTLIVDGTNATIVRVDPDYTGEAAIPAKFGGFTPVAIGENAFLNNTGITKIDLPAGLTQIPDRVFATMSGMTEISVDDGNTAFASFDGALYTKDLSILKYVPQKKSGNLIVAQGCKTIAQEAASGCSVLLDIYIPDTLAEIGKWAFYGVQQSVTVHYHGTDQYFDQIAVAKGNDSFADAQIEYQVVAPGADHNWDAGVHSGGSTVYTCTVCGRTKTVADSETTTKATEMTKVPATTVKPGDTTKASVTTVPTGTTKAPVTTVPSTTKPGDTTKAPVTAATTTKPGDTTKAPVTAATTTKPGDTTKAPAATTAVQNTTAPVQPGGTTASAATTAPGSATTNNTPSYILGDLDGDGSVTAADARLALRIAVSLDKPTDIQLKAGEVDGDGSITAADARLILRFAVLLDKTFPVGSSN